MKQIKLKNGDMYDLAIGGVFSVSDDKIQIIIIPNGKTFDQIESSFNIESNIESMQVIDRIGEITETKRNYTCLDSILKQNNYVTGTETIVNNNGEKEYRDIMGTVYIVTLSKPDLHGQVKNLQETVDFLVLEGLGV